MKLKHALLHNRKLQICAALIAADCVVFTVIDPMAASALWLITGYILLGITFAALAALVASTFNRFGDQAHGVAQRLLRYVAIALFVMVGMQSIGQLTAKDVMALVPFLLLAFWYYNYGHRYTRAAIKK